MSTMKILRGTINKRTIYVNLRNVTYIERGELGGVHIHFRGDLDIKPPHLFIDRCDEGAHAFITNLERALVASAPKSQL